MTLEERLRIHLSALLLKYDDEIVSESLRLRVLADLDAFFEAHPEYEILAR